LLRNSNPVKIAGKVCGCLFNSLLVLGFWFDFWVFEEIFIDLDCGFENYS